MPRARSGDFQRRLNLLRSVNDIAGQTRIRYAIRSGRSDDALSKKTLYDCFRFHPFHLETNYAGRKLFITRCVELDVRHVGESFLHLSIELVCAGSDSCRPDVLMKPNCLR